MQTQVQVQITRTCTQLDSLDQFAMCNSDQAAIARVDYTRAPI